MDTGPGASKPFGVRALLRRPDMLEEVVARRLVGGEKAVELVGEVLVEGLLETPAPRTMSSIVAAA